jgi:hypothetical protein
MKPARMRQSMNRGIVGDEIHDTIDFFALQDMHWLTLNT